MPRYSPPRTARVEEYSDDEDAVDIYEAFDDSSGMQQVSAPRDDLTPPPMEVPHIIQDTLSGSVVFSAGDAVDKDLPSSILATLTSTMHLDANLWPDDDEPPDPRLDGDDDAFHILPGALPYISQHKLTILMTHPSAQDTRLSAQESSEAYFGGAKTDTNFFLYPDKSVNSFIDYCPCIQHLM